MPSPFFKRKKKKKRDAMKNWNTLRNTRDKTMGRGGEDYEKGYSLSRMKNSPRGTRSRRVSQTHI